MEMEVPPAPPVPSSPSIDSDAGVVHVVQESQVQESQVQESQVQVNQDEETSPEGQRPCPYCQEVPCWREQGLSEVLADVMEVIDENPDNQMTAKEIRYTLYRHAIAYMYSHLGKGNRRQIPQCILTDIHDIAPERDPKDYVGFHESGVN